MRLEVLFLPQASISNMLEKVYEILQKNLVDVMIVAEQPGGGVLGVIATGPESEDICIQQTTLLYKPIPMCKRS